MDKILLACISMRLHNLAGASLFGAVIYIMLCEISEATAAQVAPLAITTGFSLRNTDFN